MRRRGWTPDQIIHVGGGRRGRQIAVKRVCNGCGTQLGDVTENEMLDATLGRPLLPVDHECGLCQGHHVLFAVPEARDLNWTPDDGDTWTIEVLCPGVPAGAAAMPCGIWEPCGCVTDCAPLTVEFELFVAGRCPTSPTGEHRYRVESGRVAAPTGGCWYQQRAGLAEAAAGRVTGPGLYPVTVDAFDDETPVFELVSQARRDATRAAL